MIISSTTRGKVSVGCSWILPDGHSLKNKVISPLVMWMYSQSSKPGKFNLSTRDFVKYNFTKDAYESNEEIKKAEERINLQPQRHSDTDFIL